MARLAFPPSYPVRLSPAAALAEGIGLSTMYGMAVSPIEIAPVFSRAKVRYVPVGAHALNLYTGKPRATQDADFLTAAPKKARRAVEQAYPSLTAEEHPVVIRFKQADRYVLDLIKVTSRRFFREALRHVRTVKIEGEGVVVPTIEAALALKFCSMINPNRPLDDRRQDAVDFSRAAKFQKKIDSRLLHALGEFVYTGGGDAVVKLLEDARAERRLEILETRS